MSDTVFNIAHYQRDRRLDGLVQAHSILADYSRALPDLKWWQLGRAKYHKMVALNELSDRLYAEISRQQSDLLNALLKQAGDA